MFFLDIFGKVTSKIIGLYSETKLDKVVYKHEQIGIEGHIEFPQSQARASEVIPTQVLQGTRKKRVR
jgi:hypothetical protein